MRRRDFLKVVVGSASALTVAAHAQQTAAPVIGFLRSSSRSDSTELVAAFRQGLKEAGYIENQNVAVEYRWADGRQDQLPKFAASLVNLHVAVIVVNHPAFTAVKAATATTPIVFVTGGDPVAAGFVPNLNRPGGNVTGVSFFDIPLAAKRLQLMRILVPKAEVIAALLDSNLPSVQTETRELEAASRTLKQKIVVMKVGRSEKLDAAFSTVAQSGAGGLLVGSGPYFRSRSRELVDLAARHRIPAIYTKRISVIDGGLLSYAASMRDAYRRAGVYVARILKGEKPGDLPVELPTKYELTINLKTAKSLGLDIPQSLLATADEVIE
jgi:ABC-type uncharacterized transport system substrate-binding protein